MMTTCAEKQKMVVVVVVVAGGGGGGWWGWKDGSFVGMLRSQFACSRRHRCTGVDGGQWRWLCVQQKRARARVYWSCERSRPASTHHRRRLLYALATTTATTIAAAAAAAIHNASTPKVHRLRHRCIYIYINSAVCCVFRPAASHRLSRHRSCQRPQCIDECIIILSYHARAIYIITTYTPYPVIWFSPPHSCCTRSHRWRS